MEFLVLVVMLGTLAVASLMFGVDSRPGFRDGHCNW
jgi:hypothetical protein